MTKRATYSVIYSYNAKDCCVGTCLDGWMDGWRAVGSLTRWRRRCDVDAKEVAASATWYSGWLVSDRDESWWRQRRGFNKQKQHRPVNCG